MRKHLRHLKQDSLSLTASTDALLLVDAAALEVFLFVVQAGQLEGLPQVMHRRSTPDHSHITAVTTNSHLQCMGLLKTRRTTATAIKVILGGNKVESNCNSLRARIDRQEAVILYTALLPALHLEREGMGSLDDAAHC